MLSSLLNFDDCCYFAFPELKGYVSIIKNKIVLQQQNLFLPTFQLPLLSLLKIVIIFGYNRDIISLMNLLGRLVVLVLLDVHVYTEVILIFSGNELNACSMI